jgi:DNA anti-recombination protein RmuC
MKLRKVKKQTARDRARLEERLDRQAEEIRRLREAEAAFRSRTEKLLQDTQKSLKAMNANNHRMLVGILQERIGVFLDKEIGDR